MRERLWDSDICEIQKATYYASLCDIIYDAQNIKIKEELDDIAEDFVRSVETIKFTDTLRTIYKDTREKMYKLILNVGRE